MQELVFKQRKTKMLEDIESGRYKMLFKYEEFQNKQILRDNLKYGTDKSRFSFVENIVFKKYL